MSRECIVTSKEIAAMHRGKPEPLVQKLKAAGFVFVREACPVKIAAPWRAEGLPHDGSVKFTQEDSAGVKA